jgi:hypothetical protein
MNMTMRWSWPEHKATGIQHTVETSGGRCAGFLVRSSTSSADLGYIWPVGNAWLWRTPDGKNYGERSSQVAAVKVLRQAFDLRREPALPFDDPAPAPQSPRPQSPRPSALRAPQPPRPSGPRPSGPTAPQSPPAPRPQSPRPSAPTAPRPKAPPAPEAPMERIVWGDQAPDLTSTLASLLHPTKK